MTAPHHTPAATHANRSGARGRPPTAADDRGLPNALPPQKAGRRVQRSIHLRNRLLPALVGLLIALQLLVPYRGWSVLLIGLGGLWLIAYLWARSLAAGLGLRRETRFGWTQVGDTMLERFTLSNNRWAPAVWLRLIDHSSMPGLEGGRATRISGDTSHRWHSEFVCTRRGLFSLGPTTLRSGDPFGVYAVDVHDPAAASLLVMPPIVPLPQIRIAAGGMLREGPPREHALVQSVSAGRVAAYQPGDSLRWIHWPTSARRDSMYVRQFDTSSAGHWWIVLDLDRAVQAGEGQDSTLEHAIILAASLADRALQAGRAVGLAAYAGKAAGIWLAPRSGPAQRWEILRALTLAETGSRSLAALLRRGGAGFGRSASLVIITPSTDQQWIATLIPLMQAGAAPSALLLDRASFGGQNGLPPAVDRLAAQGIPHYVVRRGLLDLPERASRPWRAVQPGEHAWEVVA